MDKLLEPRARIAIVLLDEPDAGRFQRRADGIDGPLSWLPAAALKANHYLNPDVRSLR